MNNNVIILQTENHKLRDQINKFKQVCGLVSYIEDSTLKGGYRVVSSIKERDAIDACHRKIGMIVTVRITETEYKNYRLISKNNWAEVTSDGTIPGLSNYDLAVLDGFEGTLEEYLDSLKGENGKDFKFEDFTEEQIDLITGPQGIQGIQGIKGEVGEHGLTGPTGEKGDIGLTGLKGDQGIQGVAGNNGENGTQGIQGIQGIKGDDGIQGIKGDKGDIGNTGLQGIPGIDGSIQTITMDVNNDMHLILQISSNPTIEMIIDTDGHLKLV